MIIYLLFEFVIPSAVDTVYEKSNAFFILNTNVLIKCLTCDSNELDKYSTSLLFIALFRCIKQLNLHMLTYRDWKVE